MITEDLIKRLVEKQKLVEAMKMSQEVLGVMQKYADFEIIRYALLYAQEVTDRLENDWKITVGGKYDENYYQ